MVELSIGIKNYELPSVLFTPPTDVKSIQLKNFDVIFLNDETNAFSRQFRNNPVSEGVFRTDKVLGKWHCMAILVPVSVRHKINYHLFMNLDRWVDPKELRDPCWQVAAPPPLH